MPIGVSSACLYPEKTEDAVRLLADAGIKTIEIFFNSQSEFEPGFIANIGGILRQNGIKLRSVHPYCSCFEPFLLFSGYHRRFEDGLNMYRRFFEASAELGADIFILHGDKADGKISENEYFERFARLSDAAAEYGIIFAQENVNNHRSQSPDFIKHMRQYLGDKAKFVLDLKQCIRAGYSPYQIADAMGDAIVHIHISDHNGENTCLMPGLGNFDFKKFFNYSESIRRSDKIVEVYRDAYGNFDQFFKMINDFLQNFEEFF